MYVAFKYRIFVDPRIRLLVASGFRPSLRSKLASVKAQDLKRKPRGDDDRQNRPAAYQACPIPRLEKQSRHST